MGSWTSIGTDLSSGNVEGKAATRNDLFFLDNDSLCRDVYCMGWGVLNQSALNEHAVCLVNGGGRHANVDRDQEEQEKPSNLIRTR